MHHFKNIIIGVKSFCTLTTLQSIKITLVDFSTVSLNVSVHQRTALYVAAEEGQLDVVKYFVDGGLHMGINSKYNNGVSILCSG